MPPADVTESTRNGEGFMPMLPVGPGEELGVFVTDGGLGAVASGKVGEAAGGCPCGCDVCGLPAASGGAPAVFGASGAVATSDDGDLAVTASLRGAETVGDGPVTLYGNGMCHVPTDGRSLKGAPCWECLALMASGASGASISFLAMGMLFTPTDQAACDETTARRVAVEGVISHEPTDGSKT
mmetsp:Transcript_115518/g.333707  ORF Transcript_115518/g.333707 Transcript_115518/m.333707 type:complete len:183 (-) Transcript_115518:95-643(-)